MLAATTAQFGAADLDRTVQIVAIIVAVVLLLLTVELVRRRRLVERYALLWMVGATALLVLAVFPSLLDALSEAVGIAAPANGLFVLSLGIIYVILLHFSVAISRLGEEVKLLAQESARLDQELRAEREARGRSAGAARVPLEAEQPQDEPPVATQGRIEQP